MNKEKICPGLGLSYDPSDHRNFINPLHYCYYLSRPDTISPQHQESYCLTSNHVNCPVYLRKLKETPPEPTPIAVAEPVKQSGIAEKRPKLQSFTLVTILLSVVLVILLVLIFTSPNLTGTDSSAEDPMAVLTFITPKEITPNATGYAELTQQAILYGTPTFTFDLFPSRTSIAFRSPTVIICSKPDDWILYQVVEGDTLISLASLTNLTVVDLMAANCMTTNSLAVGQSIFLPYYPGSATATATATIRPTATRTRTATPTSPLAPTSKPIQPTATYTNTIAPTATNTIVATTVNPLFRDTPTPVPPTDTDTPEP